MTGTIVVSSGGGGGGGTTLNVTVVGNGTVTSDDGGINCGSDCSQPYTSASTVTLTATPNGSATFSGWSGDCTGTGTCVVTMDANHSATATFVGGSGGGGGGGGGAGASAASGDFNGNGFDDLVVIDQQKGEIELFMGSATGFPASPTIIPPTVTGYSPVAVAAGSFNANQDSFQDIVLVEKDPLGLSILSIYKGNGAGGFTLFKQRTVNGLDTSDKPIRAIEAGDFNGDTLPDLAVTGPINSATNDVIVVVLNGDGFGNFSNTGPFPPIGNISLAPGTVSLETSQTQTFTASLTDASGAPAPNVALQWATSNAGICSLVPSAALTDVNGLVTAVATGGAVGSATITVAVGDPNDPTTPKATATCNVVVPQRDVTASGVSLSGLSLTNTVQNSGNVKLNSFRVGFYLSTDNVINPTTDVLVGSRTVSELQAGASSTEVDTISIGGIPPGTYYVGIYADDTGQIAETNETNNGKATATPVTLASDLVAVSINASLSSGNINITNSVRNGGTLPADNVVVNFYLSADATITTGDLLLCSRTIATLAAGATDTTLTACPAAGQPAGSYRAGMIVDPANVFSETNEGNNTGLAVGTLTLVPDLVASSIIASLSSGNINITNSVRNSGTLSADNILVNFYLSTDATITTGDLLLCSRTIATLAGNGTNTTTTSCSTAGQPAGSYRVGMIVDPDNAISESNEGNNTALATATLTIGPDLLFSSLSATMNLGNITISNGVRNSGNQPANNVVVNFYLSTDTTITTGDLFLCSRTIATLAVNATNSASTVCSAAGQPPGTYYVGAIVDPDDTIPGELNEGNNSRATTTTIAVMPDLRVSNTPTATKSGSNVITSGLLFRNSGTLAASNVIVNYYLSTDTTITTSDLVLCSRTIATLAINGSVSTSFTCSAVGQPAGTYYVGAIIDPDDAILESDEGNNISVASVGTITLP